MSSENFDSSKIYRAIFTMKHITSDQGSYCMEVRLNEDYFERVKALQEEGFDINAQDKNGNTYLNLYVKDNMINIIRPLCNIGVDASIPDNAGMTPMQNARNLILNEDSPA